MGFLLGLVVVGAVVTLGLSVTIGGNDAANAIGPAVGARALGIRHAIALGVLFEVLGVLLMGSFVSSTLKSDVVDPDNFEDATSFAVGMFAALLSSAVCLLLFTLAALPVSTTQTVVGGILGFGVVAGNGVNGHIVGKIVLTWFLSPLFSLALGWLFYRGVRRVIFDAADPPAASRALAPHFFALTAAVLSGFVALVSADVFGLPLWMPAAVLVGVGAACFVAARLWLLPHLPDRPDAEEPFRWLIVLTACAVAFSQGANDVANAIGPYAVIVELHGDGAIDGDSQTLELWILAIGAVGVASGLLLLGHRVIATVGTKITRLTFSRGFAAQLSTAITVMILTYLAIPVSTTTTLVGAIAGVGLAVHEHLEVQSHHALEDMAHGEVDVVPDAVVAGAGAAPAPPRPTPSPASTGTATATVSSGDGSGAVELRVVEHPTPTRPAGATSSAAGTDAGAAPPKAAGRRDSLDGFVAARTLTPAQERAVALVSRPKRQRVNLLLVGQIVGSWFLSVLASGLVSAAIYAVMEAVR